MLSKDRQPLQKAAQDPPSIEKTIAGIVKGLGPVVEAQSRDAARTILSQSIDYHLRIVAGKIEGRKEASRERLVGLETYLGLPCDYREDPRNLGAVHRVIDPYLAHVKSEKLSAFYPRFTFGALGVSIVSALAAGESGTVLGAAMTLACLSIGGYASICWYLDFHRYRKGKFLFAAIAQMRRDGELDSYLAKAAVERTDDIRRRIKRG